MSSRASGTVLKRMEWAGEVEGDETDDEVKQAGQTQTDGIDAGMEWASDMEQVEEHEHACAHGMDDEIDKASDVCNVEEAGQSQETSQGHISDVGIDENLAKL